MTW
jgi:hypothetical protein